MNSRQLQQIWIAKSALRAYGQLAVFKKTTLVIDEFDGMTCVWWLS